MLLSFLFCSLVSSAFGSSARNFFKSEERKVDNDDLADRFSKLLGAIPQPALRNRTAERGSPDAFEEALFTDRERRAAKQRNDLLGPTPYGPGSSPKPFNETITCTEEKSTEDPTCSPPPKRRLTLEEYAQLLRDDLLKKSKTILDWTDRCSELAKDNQSQIRIKGKDFPVLDILHKAGCHLDRINAVLWHNDTVDTSEAGKQAVANLLYVRTEAAKFLQDPEATNPRKYRSFTDDELDRLGPYAIQHTIRKMKRAEDKEFNRICYVKPQEL